MFTIDCYQNYNVNLIYGLFQVLTNANVSVKRSYSDVLAQKPIDEAAKLPSYVSMKGIGYRFDTEVIILITWFIHILHCTFMAVCRFNNTISDVVFED